MSSGDRRAFFRSSGGAVIGAALWAQHSREPATSTREDWPRPCPPSAWKKHGAIAEGSNFTSPAEPLANGNWRIWCSGGGTGIAYVEGVPGKEMRTVSAQLSPGDPADAPLSIGNLPAGWRPTQPVHIQMTNDKHRIYFWAHGQRIVRYLAADSEDGRRYRVLDPLRPVLYHPNDRTSYGVQFPGNMTANREPLTLPDGEPRADPNLIVNDATTVYQLSNGTFEIYTASLIPVAKDDPAYIEQDNARGWLRVIDRYTSRDGLHMEPRQRIIKRDAADRVDQQFYYLSVTHTPKGRVGMLGHYPCSEQTMEIEWCFSRDGIVWERPLREPWLRRGTPAEPDSLVAYANNRLVQHEGRWHLFYSGGNSTHNGRKSYGQRRRAIMYATTDSIWA